jgi:hypothetical protein
MPLISADKIVYHDLYASGNVNGYSLPNNSSHIIHTYKAGDKIGNVFSYVQATDGNVYWMVYANDNDFANFIPTYIKHDGTVLNVPDLPGIIQQIQDELQKQQIAQKGVVIYYLDKYLPYIVGGIVIAIALPAILKKRK